MATLYLDVFSGISGDMFLGALLDLGVDFNALEAELLKLGVEGYHLHSHRGQKSGISGVKFDVHLAHGHVHEHEHEHGDEHGHAHEHEPRREHGHHHGTEHEHRHDHGHGPEPENGHEHGHSSHGRNFQEIRLLIESSALSTWVKEKAAAVFRRIAAAEGRVHGVPAEQVHFHEVGAVDSIVDVVGACAGLEMLGRPRVLASLVVEGTGWVRCDHGNFPLPAPATLAILGDRGVGVTQCDEPQELVTPTGAALLAEFAEEFGPMNNLVARRIGIGLGSRDNRTRPNVLRAILSDDSTPAHPIWETDTVAVLESNLDDITAELLGGFLEKAMEAGALDVFFTPIQMKKNRPGVLLSVLCATADADRFSEMILRETSAFGVRRSTPERRKLFREFRRGETPWGEATIKAGLLGREVVQAAPEYESCRALAARSGVPVRLVFEAARAAARQMLTPHSPS